MWQCGFSKHGIQSLDMFLVGWIEVFTGSQCAINRLGTLIGSVVINRIRLCFGRGWNTRLEGVETIDSGYTLKSRY